MWISHIYNIFSHLTTQPVVELVEWPIAESEVSGSKPGSILTSRTETSSLSRVVRDDGDPCSVPLSGWKNVSYSGVFDFAAEQPPVHKVTLKIKKINYRLLSPAFAWYFRTLCLYLSTKCNNSYSVVMLLCVLPFLRDAVLRHVSEVRFLPGPFLPVGRVATIMNGGNTSNLPYYRRQAMDSNINTWRQTYTLTLYNIYGENIIYQYFLQYYIFLIN